MDAASLGAGERQTGKLSRLISWLESHIHEHTALIILSVIVGVLAGLANAFLHFSMDFVHRIFFTQVGGFLSLEHGGIYKVLLPLLPIGGALLLIPLSLAFPGEINGYGFPNFIEKVNLKGGFLKLRNILLKTFAVAITIGSGGSAGVEGPIAIIGGTVGSGIGQYSRASGQRLKLLIAAGAGAGIAATFNAPIAGVMFAMEIVLLGDYEMSSFAAIVIAAAMATVVTRAVYGPNPAFIVPQYHLKSMAELPLYMVFGVLMGFLGVLYIKVFHGIADKFEKVKIHPQMKPVLGGLIIGLIAIFLPQVMGNGYDIVNLALVGKITFVVVLLLTFFKIVATSITIGSGGAGGVFAPSLFIGAMAGDTYGYIVHWLFPGFTAGPAAYSAVGIGAFLAAATHAPLTGIFLMFEMTGDYKIIVPVMLSAVIGTLVAKRVCHDSIDTVPLTRRGINLHAGREVGIMSSINVKDVMREDFVTAQEDSKLDELINEMINRENFYIPVLNTEGLMTGIVSFHDVRLVVTEERVRDVVRAKEIATEDVLVLFPDQDLNAAVEKFTLKEIDELPVVERGQPRKVIGMISRKDVFSAYNKEVLKKAAEH
ncbi:MAG: chloride channel protein [Candidatus Sulfobium sp.]|jgi:chloride channel protein, CIC family